MSESSFWTDSNILKSRMFLKQKQTNNLLTKSQGKTLETEIQHQKWGLKNKEIILLVLYKEKVEEQDLAEHEIS